MKAITVSQYGGPEVMKFEDVPDPSPGPGEVLVRLTATSVNPIDMKRRSGEAQSFAPISFPGIVGKDVAGTIVNCGPGVKAFTSGDQVFGLANQTYAELCVVKADDLVRVPTGLDLLEAAALPLVITTGYQLIMKGARVSKGESVLVAGAVGGVGRAAVFTAKALGARVIAGVRKKQLEQAKALNVDDVVALDDPVALAALPAVDAVADAVGGATAEALIGKVKAGGLFASVLGEPQNSANFSSVKVVMVVAEPDEEALLELAKAVVEGKLAIPIATKMPLRDAAEAHRLMAKGANGKVLLLP